MDAHYKLFIAAFMGLLLIGLSLGASDKAWSAAGAAGGGAAAGGKVAPQTCDSDVWMTMENRARLETEREIMQNQNLIFKGDSVLQYVCLDSFAAHAAKHVGALFTHTTYWDGKMIIKYGDQGSYKGMDVALRDAVTASMSTFINGAFSHAPLGGRGEKLGLTKMNVTPVPGSGGDYSCSQMATVWAAAKCLNFMHNQAFADTDGFFPFKNLKAGPGGKQNVEGYEKKIEVRNWPTKCGGTPVPGSWQQFYDFSRNSENGTTFNKYYDFGTPNNDTFTAVRTLVEPGECGTAVQTGVTIILSPSSTTQTPDGVCTNPGCTYINNTCTAGVAGQQLDPAGRPIGGN